ncbi:MAG TPA: sulfurtransferase TusA family protein, partial [Cyanobacteria bacterium UBA11368]|nr:sulfurtransferase TusA family protein [Cyanobacteria bacterium UBA11368]
MSNPTLLTPDAQMDLRGTPCPINFVRTKLRLEKMAPGQLLEVWLDGGEPIEQV